MNLTQDFNGEMPVLPLRGLAVFPNMTVHFDVAREASIKALDWAMAAGAATAFRRGIANGEQVRELFASRFLIEN